jgi:transcriptional regulator
MIVEAEVVEGAEVEAMIERLFARQDVAYLHIHYARRGCYACRVDRAGA